MSVIWAAGLAGVSDGRVRHLRQTSRQFRTLEYVARHGTTQFMASYAEAGIRGYAPRILGAFRKLVEEGNGPAVLQGMKWLLGTPDQVVEQRNEGERVVRIDLGGLGADALRALADGREPDGAEGSGAA
jgi:hypothetical protein